MICETVRKGSECVFMASAGCSYDGGSCLTIDEKCDGCKRTVEYADEKYCVTCAAPGTKWKNGNCNLATHVKADGDKKKQKINPIKASKRGH